MNDERYISVTFRVWRIGMIVLAVATAIACILSVTGCTGIYPVNGVAL